MKSEKHWEFLVAKFEEEFDRVFEGGSSHAGYEGCSCGCCEYCEQESFDRVSAQ